MYMYVKKSLFIIALLIIPFTHAFADTTCTFSRPLYQDVVGDDVSCLQQYLKQQGFFPLSQDITTYFGPLTTGAVSSWQQAYGIEPHTGYFGPVSQATYYTHVGGGTSGVSGTVPTTQQSRASLLEQIQQLFSKIVELYNQLSNTTTPDQETDQSQTTNATTTNSLAAPTIVSTAVYFNRVYFTWHEVTGAKAYHIYRKISGGTYTLLTTVTGLAYSDTSVQSRKTYSYVFTSVADDGTESVYSKEIMAQIPSSGGGTVAVPPADITELATTLGGAYLKIDPSTVFQERSATASTPAEVGDPVGTIVGEDGVYFAIANADNQRGTLGLDETGHYYINASSSVYKVQNSSGTKLALGASYVHIGGWRGTNGTMYTTSSDGKSRINMAGIQLVGNRMSTYNPSASVVYLMNSTNDPSAVPHVMRIDKATSTAVAYYNDHDNPGNDPVSVFDASSATQGLALFTNRSDIVSPNFTGRFYGGLWIPGVTTLTESEKDSIVSQFMDVVIPDEPTGHTIDTNPVVLDFTSNEFEWGGQSRNLSDLTDNGDDTYTLNYTDWWSQSHTIIADVEVPDGGSSWGGVAVALQSNNPYDEQIRPASDNPDTRTAYRGAGQWVYPDEDRVYNSIPDVARVRIGYVISPGSVVKSWVQLTRQTDGISTLPAILPPTAVVIGKDGDGNNPLTDVVLHRVALYAGAKSESEMWTLMSEGVANPVHVLGDSFVAQGQYPERLENFTKDDGFIMYTEDGVGGVAFVEPDGTGHAQRFDETPQYYDSTLIIVDGGFEYDHGETEIKTAIADILGHLTHTRYLLVEPNPLNVVGSNKRDLWVEGMTWIMEAIDPTHFVPTLEAMYAANDGSSDDLSDVSTGLWPRSLTADGTHPNADGKAVYSKAMYGAAVDKGYLPGTTALPGTVQNLAAATSSGAVTLTWDAPLSDGNYPIEGYKVEQETSSGSGVWTELSAQGSPTGFTKQYIRSYSLTGLTNGTEYSFRITAITEKGEGNPTEITATPSA